MSLVNLSRQIWRRCRDVAGSQIAEFAVCVPLLTVFAVGIFDFSGAFNLKQKLASAAQEGALIAAAQPTYDLLVATVPPPPSIQAVEKAIFLDLVDQNVLPAAVPNTVNCGGPPAVVKTTTVAWTYTTTGCPGTLTIIIDRGAVPPAGTSGEKIIYSHITVQYPHLWQFQNVIQLVGGSSALPPFLSVEAYAANQS